MAKSHFRKIANTCCHLSNFSCFTISASFSCLSSSICTSLCLLLSFSSASLRLLSSSRACCEHRRHRKLTHNYNYGIIDPAIPLSTPSPLTWMMLSISRSCLSFSFSIFSISWMLESSDWLLQLPRELRLRSRWLWSRWTRRFSFSSWWREDLPSPWRRRAV